MPHPYLGYKINGVKVPSVTTIIGRYSDKTELMNWYCRCGREGKEPDIESKRAANAGTACHALIEIELAGGKIPNADAIREEHKLDDEQLQWTRNAFMAFRSWKRLRNPKIKVSELGMLCESLMCGGTLDSVGTVDGIDGLLIMDWKTSSSTSNYHIVQVGAYAYMYEEQTGEKIDGGLIVRFDKKKAEYHETICTRDEMNEYLEVFKAWRNSYEVDSKHGTLRFKHK